MVWNNKKGAKGKRFRSLGKEKESSRIFPLRDALLLLPGLFGFVFFYAYPAIRSFQYAFVTRTFNPEWAGLAQFQFVLKDHSFQRAISNSLIVMLQFSVVGMLLSSFMAVFLFEIKGNRWIHGISLLTVFLPAAGIGRVWRIWPYAMNNRMRMLLFSEWKYIGIPLTVLLFGLHDVEKDQIDAAALDGANRFQQYRYVIIPETKWYFHISTCFLIVQSQRLFREGYVLFGNYPEKDVFLLQHYMLRLFNQINYPALAAAAMLMLLIYGIICIPLLAGRRKR